MARRTAMIWSEKTPTEVFDYLCDMRNASAWDHGVANATVSGPGVHDTVSEGTTFDVTLNLAGRTRHVPYRATEYDRPRRVVLVGLDPTFRSLDTITVATSAGRTKLTYEAVIEPLGAWKLASPFIALSFGRIFRRAEAGLARELGG